MHERPDLHDALGRPFAEAKATFALPLAFAVTLALAATLTACAQFNHSWAESAAGVMSRCEFACKQPLTEAHRPRASATRAKEDLLALVASSCLKPL